MTFTTTLPTDEEIERLRNNATRSAQIEKHLHTVEYYAGADISEPLKAHLDEQNATIVRLANSALNARHVRNCLKVDLSSEKQYSNLLDEEAERLRAERDVIDYKARLYGYIAALFALTGVTIISNRIVGKQELIRLINEEWSSNYVAVPFAVAFILSAVLIYYRFDRPKAPEQANKHESPFQGKIVALFDRLKQAKGRKQ